MRWVWVVVPGCAPWTVGAPDVPPDLSGEPWPRMGFWPVVARMTDDDGDWTIDENDPVDVAFVLPVNPEYQDLVVRDGTSGEVHLERRGWYTSPLLVADVTGDGQVEIVVRTDGWTHDFENHAQLEAIHGDGSMAWVSDPLPPGEDAACTPVAADLEGDGDAEVVCGTWILDGVTGVGVAETESDVDRDAPTILVDLDADGTQEIIRGRVIHDAFGALIATLDHQASTAPELAVMDVDDDGVAEIVSAIDSDLVVWDRTGVVRWERKVSQQARPVAPCVADFDGDGASEIAVGTANGLSLFEADGTRVWQREFEVGESRWHPPCIAVDFDDTWAIALSAYGRVRILDGTGDEVWTEEGEAIAGGMAAADLDGDGLLELVIGKPGGLAVLGPHRGRAPAIWPSYDHGPSNIGPEGQVLTSPEPSWVRGRFRAVR